jgi:hypothetical protein
VAAAGIVQSAGHGFDEAALAAARQFEFSPGQIDGQPVAVRLLYTYEFLYRPESVPLAQVPDEVNFQGLILERGTRKPIEGATIVVGTGADANSEDFPRETTPLSLSHWNTTNLRPRRQFAWVRNETRPTTFAARFTGPTKPWFEERANAKRFRR